jgi:energy-coupling factor transporter transmembrane protein EcfT
VKITDIDYYAQYGKSWLNSLSAGIKILAVLAVVLTVVFSANLQVLAVLYLALLLVIAFSSVPKLKIVKVSLFPLVFLVLFLVSINNLTLETVFVFVFKALSASTVFSILVFTTSYVKIFSTISGVLPDFAVNILFMTYRSIFILAKTFENMLDMLRFRGMPAASKPVLFLEAFGNLVGFFVIKSIQTGENMYDAMNLRGYSGNFNYLKGVQLKGNHGKNR